MEFEEHLDEAQKVDSKNEEGIDHKVKEDINISSADRFTELMFGSRASGDQQNRSNKEEIPNEEVNYFTIMEQIGDIMDSLENLKPILQHLSPIMDYIKKKK